MAVATSEPERLKIGQLQAYADAITKEYGVPRIPIVVTDRHLKGQAVYNTWKRKGERQWHPKNIQVGDWNVVSTHPGEMIMRLGHELAHHIENTKRGSLAHSSRHGNLEDEVGLKLSRKWKETKATKPSRPPIESETKGGATMAIATEIKTAMSEAIQRQQRVHPWELTEAQYADDRVRREITRYERAIEQETKWLDQIPTTRPKAREKTEWNIKMWRDQLGRLRSGEWKKVNTNYLHQEYGKMVKKAISTGQPVPQAVINQAPEYKAAQTARERYEKGWKTSFANRSVAINEQMKEELGYKVKRQDGKPITSGQLDDIAKGVGDAEDVLGPLHDLFDKTDITIVHTSGKHPFLSGFGGTYTSQEKAVNIGVAGVKALGHELGHWLDFESGKAENLSSRIYSKAGKSHEITSTAESWQGRYKDQKPTALGQLIDEARMKINKMREVREYMKADYGKDKSAEEKEEIKLVREHLTPYWREPREIWARLVEQYIATKKGKAGLATDSPEHYEHRPGWWAKEDFAKMMPQVETLIKGRLRALRGSDVAPPRKTATAEKKLEAFADDVKQIEKTTPPPLETKADTKLLPPPARVEPIKPVAKTEAIAPGDVITDGTITGRVLAEGLVRIGGEDVEGYQVIADAGQRRIIPKSAAKLIRHEPARAPETPKPTPEAKEPWKMTSKEWRDAKWANRYLNQELSDEERAKRVAENRRLDYGLFPHGREMQLTHDEIIKKALKEGKPVPAEVLKDYPELGKKPKKEAWEMTVNEWQGLSPSERNAFAGKSPPFPYHSNFHVVQVIDAIKGGKPVPQKVIDSFGKDTGIEQALRGPAKPEPKAEGKGIRRDKRNIGKLATVIPHGTGVDGRTVKILGFRGDQRAGVPFVTVYDIQAKQSLPMPADKLRLQPTTKVKEPEPKLKKEIAKPKKATKPHKETLREIAASRVAQSERAIAIDRALLAKQVVSVDDPRWLKQPNRFDVRGVDTPGSGRVVSRTGFADRRQTRMSRKHHRGWKRIKL